jgi:hypothetical protein
MKKTEAFKRSPASGIICSKMTFLPDDFNSFNMSEKRDSSPNRMPRYISALPTIILYAL